MELSGLTLVGEDMEGTRAHLESVGPGAVIPIDQDIYEELGAEFERGDRAGWLHGAAILTSRDRLVCQLTFFFASDPEDSIVAGGVLPREGDDWGAGVLAVLGGTGRFSSATGMVRVETRNPKRYIF